MMELVSDLRPKEPTVSDEASSKQNLPDGNDLMLAITNYAELMYRAAMAANWRLAEHNLRAVIKRLKAFATHKPRFQAVVKQFIENQCQGLALAIDLGDIAFFDSAWEQFIEATNQVHREGGFGYIQVSTPTATSGMIQFAPLLE